ncbi:hypothetical protein PAPYR_2776 [Paratrimastix pyriformis]|uniref:ADP-ribosylation factor-like protein 16 n=1 Tax=Paratrimastix pyriformis TaxID=342808 RepID=A0ABQ8UP31_9EUKA|nr:hypothetical protein PAPYR_2776 [Paratrimastix pyriformis]
MPPFSLREVGGTFVPLWQKSFKDCRFIVYLIDVSNVSQVAASLGELAELLLEPVAARKPLLILLTKTDAPCRVPRAEFSLLVHEEDLAASFPKLAIIETSALTHQNFDEILQWMGRNMD